MATDFYKWIDEKRKPFGSLRPSQLLCKIVVANNKRWFSEDAFIEIKLGKEIPMGTRYIYFISESELKSDWNDDLELLGNFLADKILEVNK